MLCTARLIAVLLLCCLLGACRSTGPGRAADTATPVRRNPQPAGAQLAATVRPGDNLSVQLQSIPDAAEFRAQVDDAGFINLRYIGRIAAAGLTPSELGDLIRRTYIERDYYKTIDVAVSVAERYVYVGGEVARPGRVLWAPDLTLTSAITAAGGFSPYARESAVILNRDDASYTFDARLASRNPSEDSLLIPGDRLTVPKSTF